MKKGWMFLLLISLGLNLGLGLRLVRLDQPATEFGPGSPGWSGRGGLHGQRPAPGDTTAWRRFMGRRLDHLADQLDLRPDQMANFREAQGSPGRPLRQKRRELGQARLRLRELMTEEVIDRAAVRRAMKAMGRQQAEMDSLVAETVLGELEFLDPDQRLRYLDFLPDRAGRGSGHGGRGRNQPGE